MKKKNLNSGQLRVLSTEMLRVPQHALLSLVSRFFGLPLIRCNLHILLRSAIQSTVELLRSANQPTIELVRSAKLRHRSANLLVIHNPAGTATRHRHRHRHPLHWLLLHWLLLQSDALLFRY